MIDLARVHLFLQKYDVAGPRYTSYPTVPAWTTAVGAAQYQQSLQSLKPSEKLSLYFHLPFCESLCHFCGCMQVITKDHSRSAGYVQTLLKEIDQVLQFLPAQSRDVIQIHFGGGTPNFLQPDELTQIMSLIRKNFKVLPDAEIAIEMHPRTSTSEFCQNLKKLGFNRISLGIQDFNPVVQKLINRNQTYEMTKSMIEQLRALGFQSFNFDLVYGLPGQSMEGWQDSLQKVLGLSPDRLAVYSYAHVPWMRPVQRSFKDKDLPSPELKLKLFEGAFECFTQSGFTPIGMDHFAKAEDELAQAAASGNLHRNFMGYSTRADAHQIGFGVSAISFVAGNYFQNEKELKKYTACVEEGGVAPFRGFILSREDSLRRDLITRIMCAARVDIREFEKKWGIDFKIHFAEPLQQLKIFLDDHLLKWDGSILQVQNEGTLFLRNMAMVFDTYLENIREKATTPTFSRTV